MEFMVVVILSFLVCICNGNGPSTQSSVEAETKETRSIQSDINVLKDSMHELLKRVIKNENEISSLKSENQFLTNKIENERRQLSCDINVFHENTNKQQQALTDTNTEINHLNETIEELRNGVDKLEELQRRRSEDNITECIDKPASVPPCVPTNCPEGYIISNNLTASTNCYFFSGDDEQSWSNALNICRMKGAYLWAPKTVAEAITVKSTTGFGQNVDIWTGLYSPTSDENFEFVDAGGALTLDTLPFGERDPIQNDDCVEFEFAPNNNWNWDDDPCDRTQLYMCEFPRETCP